MRAEITTITPKLAAQLLQDNVKNRRLDPQHVESLAYQMIQGGWKAHGTPIQISTQGLLLDGQHRLSAIVESGVTLDMLVVYDVSETAFDVIDTGKKRIASDALHIDGFSNTHLLAAAAKQVFLREQDAFTGSTMGALYKTRISNAAIREVVDRHPDLVDCVRVVLSRYRRSIKLMRPTIAVFFYYQFRKLDVVAADLFFSKLSEGAGLDAADPVYVLRQRLFDNAQSRRRMLEQDVAIMVVKTWNAVRRRTPLKVLRVLEGEKLPRWI